MDAKIIILLFCSINALGQTWTIQRGTWAGTSPGTTNFGTKKSLQIGDGVGNDSLVGTVTIMCQVTNELKFFFPGDSGYIQMSETDLFGVGLRGIGAQIPITDGGSLFQLSKHGLIVGGVGVVMAHLDADSQAYVTVRRFNGGLEASMVVVQDVLVGEVSVRRDRLLMSINNSATGLSQGIDVDISGDHPHTHIILWDTEADSANSTTLHAHEGFATFDFAHNLNLDVPEVAAIHATLLTYITPTEDTIRWLSGGSGNALYEMIGTNGGTFSITTGDSTIAGFDFSSSPAELFIDRVGDDRLLISVSELLTGAATLSASLTINNPGSRIFIEEGANSITGQDTLASGVLTVTITGLETTSRAFVQLVAQAGTSTGVYAYEAVCTTNTLTITAVTVTGTTVNTDESIVNYFIVN